MSVKRLLPLLLVLSLMLSLFLTGCETAQSEPAQDHAPLTMYVGLGNTNFDYYFTLHDAILEATGIDVTLVSNNTLDTTTAMVNRVRSDDLPADIMITAMKVSDEYAANSLLDLADRTNLTDLFSPTRVRELAEDGHVYQLPFTSRLIGIEYNRTLMDEMGWELPQTFEDMVALRDKCEEAGIPFAVSGGVATGHGFNYLFHLMGSDYLNTPDGAVWYEQFMAGEASLEPFAEACEYFERYAEAGLFGELDTADWLANKLFSRRRALFYYNILNDINSYDGFRYTEDGRLFGAVYGADGEPEHTADPAGNAVIVNGEYVLYNPADPAHEGLERYTVPGAVELHDEYGTMPWITENGASNCFTLYDNMFVGLDKRLGEPEQQERLQQAVKVLEFMASRTATDIFSGLFSDGYVATVDYEMDESRIYSDCAEQVGKGYLQRWYYNDFDNDTIVAVGALVNDYLCGGTATLADILIELQSKRDIRLAGGDESICKVTETLEYEDCARLQAIAAGLATQQSLDELGISVTVDAALAPYIRDISEIPVLKQVPLVQEKLYAGTLLSSGFRAFLRTEFNTPAVVCLTGAELRELTESGFALPEKFGSDVIFPYACVLRGGEKLSDDAEYYTAVPLACLPEALVAALTEAGKIVTDGENPVLGSLENVGLPRYVELNGVIDPKALRWE